MFVEKNVGSSRLTFNVETMFQSNRMTVDAQAIIDNLGEPQKLEILFRENETTFSSALEEALKIHPEAAVLRVWEARLLFSCTAPKKRNLKPFLSIFLIVTSTALLLIISSSHFDPEWYYPRYAPMWLSLSLAIYFWLDQRDLRTATSTLIVVALTGLYLGLLPDTSSDSVVMALVHVGVASLILPATIFLGTRWTHFDARIELLERAGEWFVICSLLVLGGGVFIALTMGLFQTIGFNEIEDWYFRNVVNIGIVGIPVLSMFIYDVVFRGKLSIAPVLARTFSPPFILMIGSYLTIMLYQGQNPFHDRQFLIVLNGLLLVILGMVVYSNMARSSDSGVWWTDWISFGLILVTLLINTIALAAIVFRWYSFGMTPNRIVISGFNLIIFVHFIWLAVSYLAFLTKQKKIIVVRTAIAGYFPIYAGWAILIGFVFPVLMKFE